MYAKKSLGQNFLKSKGAVRKIIEVSRLTPGDTVLEVGPGKGVLTEALLQHAGKVIAIEKDDRLIEFLKEKFASELSGGKLELIHGDILDLNLESYKLKAQSYKLVANIPYYITGQLIRMFLESDTQPELMTLMLQKEVAKRIVAQDKKESILSISVKAYGMPHYVETVQAKYFAPVPKVDSAILLIDTISKKFFDSFPEKKFFEYVKAGFAHKRKKLIGNLQKIVPKESLEKVFEECNISKDVRAEDITSLDWEKIAKLVSSYN